MIIRNGHQYGTADELADELACPDVTADLIRSWARRGLIARFNAPGQGRGTTYYRLDQVAAAERATRLSRRGRRRLLDTTPAAADDLSVRLVLTNRARSPVGAPSAAGLFRVRVERTDR